MKNNFFLAVLCLCFSLNAQVKSKDSVKTAPSRIKVYTPSSSESKSSKSDNSYKWTVKTDVLGIVTGEIPLIAEYRIGNKFSVEGSAGVTYSYLPNDFLTSNDTGSNYETKAAMGSAFRGTFKFYPSSDYDAIEGWSFGLQLYNKTSNRDYLGDNSSTVSLQGKRDVKTKTGLALVIGKQIFQDSNVSFEYIFGIGLATVKRDYYDLVYNNTTSQYDVQSFSTKDSKPNFQFGFRIGFGN